MRMSSPAISRTRFLSRALRDCQPAPPSLSSSPDFGSVARQKFQVFDWQEEPVAAGVMDFQAIVRRAGGFYGLEPDEAPDAVVDMDDEIACRQSARFRQHILCATLAFGVAHEPVAENVLLADDGETGRLEALFERYDRQWQALRLRAVFA